MKRGTIIFLIALSLVLMPMTVSAQDCTENQDRLFSCLGTYYTTTYTDNSFCTSTPCDDSGGTIPIMKFFRTITGNPVYEGDSGGDGCIYDICQSQTSESICESRGCDWIESISGTDTPHSCSGLTEGSCDSKSECTSSVTCVDLCSTGEIYSYTGCSGSWTTTTTTVSGDCSHDPCPEEDSAGTGFLRFFQPIITGEIIRDDCLGQAEICSGISDGPSCESNPNNCNWKDTSTTQTITHQCSGKTESQCELQSQCTPNYDCISTLKNDCQVCTSDEECQSGSCKFALGSTTKRCSSPSTCAYNQDSECLAAAGTTKCGDTNILQCKSPHQTVSENFWSSHIACETQACQYSPSGSPECVPLNPSAHWTQGERTITSATADMNLLPFPVTLKIIEASNLNAGTFEVLELDTNIIVHTSAIVGESGGAVSESWAITDLILSTVNDGDDIYTFKFSFKENGETFAYTSPEFEFTRAYAACENKIRDELENGVDCGDVCFNSCCGNGVCDINDCAPDCPPEKIWQWGVSSPLQLSLEGIYEGVEIPLQLINYESEDSKFTLKEKNQGLFGGSDTLRENLPGTPSDQTLEYGWGISVDDLKLIAESEKGNSDNIYNFYFSAENGESSILELQLDRSLPYDGDGMCEINYGENEFTAPSDCQCFGITTCSDYNALNCELDPCNVPKEEIAIGESKCLLEKISGECTRGVVVEVDGIEIGTCFYDEDTSLDTCDDGFLSYSWTSNWEWGDNSYIEKPTPGDGFIETEIDPGVWHYDPQNSQLDCKDGETTIPCPAQIQLSFVSWINLVAAAALIVLIYLGIRYFSKKEKG